MKEDNRPEKKEIEQLLDAFLELAITDRLPEIAISTCIIGGEKDLLKPPYPYSEFIHEKILNSEMVIVPESGNVITWEKPKEFNNIILGFLQKHLHGKSFVISS